MGGHAFILSGWGKATHPHLIGTAAAKADVRRPHHWSWSNTSDAMGLGCWRCRNAPDGEHAPATALERPGRHRVLRARIRSMAWTRRPQLARSPVSTDPEHGGAASSSHTWPRQAGQNADPAGLGRSGYHARVQRLASRSSVRWHHTQILNWLQRRAAGSDEIRRLLGWPRSRVLGLSNWGSGSACCRAPSFVLAAWPRTTGRSRLTGACC